MRTKTFNEIHYPRDPKKWNAEKNEKRQEAYMLSVLNGPKMGTIFHIRRAKSDLAICGIIASDHDIDHNASAIAWTDSADHLHVVCCDCHSSREMMGAETPRYSEDEISESMEFWGAWPEMEKVSDELDAEALKKGLEASGLNVQVIDENTDFSKLEFLGDRIEANE